jgi:hypothetical protein
LLASIFNVHSTKFLAVLAVVGVNLNFTVHLPFVNTPAVGAVSNSAARVVPPRVQVVA